MIKNPLAKINFPKKLKTAKKNTEVKEKPKPEWNDNINDVKKYKLTSSELVSILIYYNS